MSRRIRPIRYRVRHEQCVPAPPIPWRYRLNTPGSPCWVHIEREDVYEGDVRLRKADMFYMGEDELGVDERSLERAQGRSR
jgi:hypothetical protein